MPGSRLALRPRPYQQEVPGTEQPERQTDRGHDLELRPPEHGKFPCCEGGDAGRQQGARCLSGRSGRRLEGLSSPPVPGSGRSSDLLFFLKKSQAEAPHCCQLALKLTLGLFRGKGIKEIRQLHSPAHDLTRGFVPESLAADRAVLRVEG